MRGRGEKFNADALTFFTDFAEIDDADFLLFLGGGAAEDEHGAVLDRLIEIEQAAVGIDDDGLAGLAELAAIGILARDPDVNAQEDSRAASGCGVGEFRHGETMVGPGENGVNESGGGVCLRQNLYEGTGGEPSGKREETGATACPSEALSVEWGLEDVGPPVEDLRLRPGNPRDAAANEPILEHQRKKEEKRLRLRSGR